MADPADGFLPAVLDTLLDCLSTNLPGPLYSLFVKLLSHVSAALSAFIILCTSLLANAPESWNAQAILPPIITILAAYLALSSFYRTTSWMLRTSFWFMKWGTLLGIFMGGVGFLLGNGGGNAIGNEGGGLGGLFASVLDDPRRQTNTRSSRARKSSPKAKAKRPKAWESFERHQEWQYEEIREGDNPSEQVQQIMSTIVDAAGNVLRGNWVGAVKSIVGDAEVQSPEAAPKLSSTSPKSKRKGGTSNSR